MIIDGLQCGHFDRASFQGLQRAGVLGVVNELAVRPESSAFQRSNDAFITSKPNGRGLGLALVAKIVNDHGGVIEFDSEPRRTVFNVMLPVYSDAGRRTRPAADGPSEKS